MRIFAAVATRSSRMRTRASGVWITSRCFFWGTSFTAVFSGLGMAVSCSGLRRGGFVWMFGCRDVFLRMVVSVRNSGTREEEGRRYRFGCS